MTNERCVIYNAEKECTKLENPKAGLRVYLFLAAVLSFGILSGCSSAPKKPTEISSARIVAANQLNLANQTANQGRYEEALLILTEARRGALSTDDPELRIKTSMSRGNILFSLGRHEEAFAEWENASAEGDASGQRVLASLSRIYSIRGELVLLANGMYANGMYANDKEAAAEELKSRVNKEMALVKSDSLSTAASYVTLGLAEKQLERFPQAESAIKNALSIHEKNLSLEDAAYDWFLIASVRSVAGNYEPALEALRAAIGFDRRAENGFGLASSWQAMGEVYAKAGKAEEAKSAYSRAAEIFRAIGLEELGIRN